jgi:GT2 family glycosyltransferase/glycosyltransferase involved in cell wall biosynthesis
MSSIYGIFNQVKPPMHKAKIILRTSNKAAKKILAGNFSYRGNSPMKALTKIANYGVKSGPKALVRRIKQELISIDRRLGGNLAFPNGLTTGVDPSAIKDWYKHEAKPVTIVIPSYNDAEVLIPCLQSLKTTTDPKLVKIIIVDDYCQPSSRKFLKTLEDNQVKIVYREQNGGFAKAVNTGIEAANQKHDVILLNSDIVAHEGWLEALQYGAYEFGVDIGIVGPKLLYPDGRIQSAGSYRNTEVPKFFDHYYRFQDSNYGPANIPQYCLGVTGACMYVKREFISYIGVLDDKFQFAFEDMDWCLRGWEAGFRSLYFPAATLTHVESASRAKHKMISEKETQSVKYFWQKWGSWFDDRNVKDTSGKIKIIFILQSVGMSGGIKNVFEQASRLAKRNFSIEIWSLDHKISPWELDEKVKTRTFKNYERLITALSHEEAIKVATWWETAFPVWLASVNKGIPVYFVQEFETWFYPGNIIAQASVVACYRKEFRNLTISSFNLDELRAIGLTATLLPCGYEENIYKPLKTSRDKSSILAVGRSFFQKNFEMTLKGWQLLGANRPKLRLYGFENHMAKLDPQIEYLTKPTNEEVNQLYNSASVFVQTSRHEGFCLPILEAMAAGCPVVCTDAHGNRDFCFDGKNCLMVEQDDAEGLSRALRRLLSDDKLRAKLSTEALKTVKEFRWPAIIDRAEAFYRRVAK